MQRIVEQTKKLLAVTAIAGLFAFIFTSNSDGNPVAAADAAATYKAKCASCHAADGSGNTAAGKSMKVRDLRSADVQNQTDDQLYALVAKGKAKMPGYEKSLGADTCKALVAYIRKLGGK
jgi:cytochrome c6